MDAPVRGAGLTDTRDIVIVARTAEVAMVTVGDGLGPSGSRVRRTNRFDSPFRSG